MEDEKPNNYLNMIDIFAENGLQHISILTNKRDITATVEKRDPMYPYKNNCMQLR